MKTKTVALVLILCLCLSVLAFASCGTNEEEPEASTVPVTAEESAPGSDASESATSGEEIVSFCPTSQWSWM